MLRSMLFITGSISIGYVLWNYLYFKSNHCTVKPEIGLLSVSDLIIILGIVGFVLSLFN